MKVDKYYYIHNKRLAKYLYSLGFNKISEYINGKEIWKFIKSDNLQKSLDFYFYMRQKQKDNIQKMVICQENNIVKTNFNK